jgi:hypothetical protein
MDVNDLPHSNRYGGSAEAFVAKFQAILEGAARADQAPFMLDVTAHTHVYGRPAGAWAFDACMKIAQADKGIWIGTRGDTVAHALASPGVYAPAAA